jgi:hypothetical protein
VTNDPGRRPNGVWPRDRPIRWLGVAGNMSWFVIGTAAGAFQLALGLPVLAVGRGWLGTALALVWGVLTLFAAWSWVQGRWRVVIAPILTALVIFAFALIGGPAPPPVAGPFLTDNPAGVVPGVEYRPEIDPVGFTTAVTNPYLSLVPGTMKTFEGGGERVEVTVTASTRTVMGVETVVVRDREYRGTSLIEDTEDWFAQDEDGNVWYFGEDTAECSDGSISGRPGAWEAGVDGAQPGIVMLANPRIGDYYRQEFYAGRAEDVARVRELGASVDHDGQVYRDVLVTEDFTALEPGQIEHKSYAPEVGLIEERPAGGGTAIRLTEITVAPEPEASASGSLCQG